MVNILYAVTAFTCAVVAYILPMRMYRELLAGNPTGRAFFVLSRWIATFCLVDGIWGLFASPLINSRVLLFIFSSLFHTLAAITPLLWLMFVQSYLGTRKTEHYFVVITGAVTAAELVLIIINCFTKAMFSIDADGIYRSTLLRYVLFYLQYAVYIAIAIYAIVRRIRVGMRSVTPAKGQDRTSFNAVLMFVLAPIVLGVFQMIYPDAPAYSIGYMLGIIIVYSFVMTDMLRHTMQESALLEAASTAKSEFLFNMSHDIRTPMNAILGFADIGLRHANEADRARENFLKIKTAGNHMTGIINDILEMSRIEAGKLELSNAPFDMREAADEVEQMSRALALPKSIAFTVERGEMPYPFVAADRRRIKEVIINLISNAVKYTPMGGRVTYRTEQAGTNRDGRVICRFTVTDTGIGMSEEFLKHLFEPFSREQNATVSGEEGTGLGLSIVKHIVDKMEGSISVQSTVGAGSTFTVELPLCVSGEDEVEAQHPEGERYISVDAQLVGKRVLLAEDNEMNREIATEILTEEGMTVSLAEDGAIAVEQVIQNGADAYDFILMDIQMPVMDGFEATRTIRALPGGGEVPIIAVSANAFKEDVDKSLEAGMNAHVAKPINIKELMTVLRSLKRE